MVTVSVGEMERVKGRLRRYYLQEQQLFVLRSELEALTESLEQLKHKLGTVKVVFMRLREPQKAIDYSTPVGTSLGYAQSQQDRTIEQYGSAVEALEAAIARREVQRTRLELRIRAIEEERAPVTKAIQMFDERSRFLIDKRYGARWSFFAIGEELNVCSSAAHKMHSEILERLAVLLGQAGALESSDDEKVVRRFNGPGVEAS